MADASLDPIKTRLYGANPYHPVEAETFSDWSLEAGDVVTLKRGEDEYDSPVHTARMVWKGAPQISLNSTGNKERDAVAKVSKKKYRGGSGGMRTQNYIWHDFYSEDGYLHSELLMTESVLRTEFTDGLYGLHSELEITASHLYSHFESEDSKLSTTIEQTNSRIYAEAVNRERGDVLLQGQLDIQADRASLVVTATDTRPIKTYVSYNDFPATGSTSYIYYDVSGKKYYQWNTTSNTYTQTTPGNVIDAGGIVTRINEDNTATTQILGSKVFIGNLTNEDLNTWASEAYYGSGTFAKYLTVKSLSADDLEVLLAHIGDAEISDLNVTGTIEAAIITAQYGITTDTLEAETINEAPVGDMIASASLDQSTNELTLTTVDGEVITFSKATSLSGAWSGRTFRYAASQSNVEVNHNYTFLYNALVPDPAIPVTHSGKTVYGTYIVYSDDSGEAGDLLMRQQVSLNASDVYDDALPASGVPLAWCGPGYTWNFTITSADSSTHTLQIDCADIYSDARDGYTYGTFTQADIYLRGDDETVYVPNNVGTDYYPKDSSGTNYFPEDNNGTIYYRPQAQGSYRPNYDPISSSSGTPYYSTTAGPKLLRYSYQGSYQNELFYTPDGSHYYSAGNKYWYYRDDSNGTQYYTRGSTPAVRVGAATTLNPVDTTLSIRVGNAVKLGTAKTLIAAVRYKGQHDTTNYYTKS